jgi:hypothetical protein
MSDNLKRRRPQDSSRINLNQAYEVGYWTQILGITENELRRIVNEVGNDVEAVKTRIRLKKIVRKLMPR